jgi:hypothetical protein
MLSKGKLAQLAAAAALTVLFGANASMSPASAQAGIQLAQADNAGRDVKRTTTTRTVKTSRTPTRASNTRSSRKAVSTRTTTRSTVRSNRTYSDRNRNYSNRNAYRDRNTYRGRTVVHSRSSSSVAFVVLGPRVVYRSYGSGWCRALHSGRHWAPRIGWHRGRHVGAVRC